MVQVRLALVACACALSLALAACGSRLDPDDVAAVQGTSGTVAQDGSVPGATDPGCGGGGGRRRRHRSRNRDGAAGSAGGPAGGEGQGTGANSATGAIQGRQLQRLQEPDRHHRLHDHPGERLRHLRPGARHLRVGPGGDPRVRGVLQLQQRPLRPQARRGAARLACRLRRRPAGLHQGLRRGLRRRRVDVRVRRRRRGHRRGLRAARHPLHRGEPRAQRLRHLLRRPGDRPRAHPERGATSTSSRPRRRPPRRPRCSTSTAVRRRSTRRRSPTAAEKNGWNEVYVQGIDVSEFNYAPYVQEMKDNGVQLVQYVGPYQNTVKLQQAMQQQGFEPKVFLQDATIYDARYVEQAGEDGDGSYVYMTNQMFERTNIPEMALYQSLAAAGEARRDARPSSASTPGPRPGCSSRRRSRSAASSTARPWSRRCARSTSWTATGCTSPCTWAPRTTAECTMIIQLNGGKWSQKSPGQVHLRPAPQRRS